MSTSARSRLYRDLLLGASAAAILLGGLLTQSTTGAFYGFLSIPWIGVALYRHANGRIAFIARSESRRWDFANVYVGAVLCPLIPLWHANSSQLRWELLFLAGLGVGCVLTAAALYRLRRWAIWEILIFALLNSCYGIPLAASLNQDLDRQPPTSYMAQVLARYESKSRGHPLYLRLAPWGPWKSTKEIKVSVGIYRQAVVGKPACILLHSGALRIPWYELTSCQNSQ